jgi:hypothetical protein
MATRESISKKARFEVFKRDNFTCQYCGAKAPDVILHVDHINPVSKGGGNDILNLITACAGCNGGKSDRLLSDRSEIEKQRGQLEELNERRQQLEWMLEWRDQLERVEDDTLTALVRDWEGRATGYGINDHGRRNLTKWLKRFSVEELLNAIKLASEQYLVFEGDEPTAESVQKAFSMIPRVAGGVRIAADAPYMRDVFYIRAVLRNRLNYVNEQDVIRITKEAILLGVDVDRLRQFSKEVRSWTAYRESVEAFIADNQPREGE